MATRQNPLASPPSKQAGRELLTQHSDPSATKTWCCQETYVSWHGDIGASSSEMQSDNYNPNGDDFRGTFPGFYRFTHIRGPRIGLLRTLSLVRSKPTAYCKWLAENLF